MQKQKIRMPALKETKKDAGELLDRSQNRLLLVEALILMMISAVLYSTLYGVWSLCTSVWVPGSPMAQLIAEAILWLAVLVISLFLTVPLFIGFLRMAGDLTAVGGSDLLQLFSSFRSEHWQLTLRLSFGLCLRVALLALYVRSLGIAAADLDHPVAEILCGAATLAGVAVWIFLLMRRFPLLAVAIQSGMPMREVRQYAGRMHARMPGAGYRFLIGFVPDILLGLLTFGILLVWDTLPRMAVSYFGFCRGMNDLINRSEE